MGATPAVARSRDRSGDGTAATVSTPRNYLRRTFVRIGDAASFRLRVVFADGSAYSNYSGPHEPDVAVRFLNRSAEWRAAAFFPDGLVEAWINGNIDFLGHRPVLKLAGAAHRALTRGPARLMPFNPLVRARQMVHEERTNNRSVKQALRNLEFHYSIDWRFFERMLGPTLGYSEGYWAPGTQSLDQAKYNNYLYICRKLHLEPGHRVLEVGPGWGYMPILMSKVFGADVTAYNPVAAQNTFMHTRFAKQGVARRIRLIEKDHRAVVENPSFYDRFVSIGVQEHCGKDCYREWINSIAVALKPGGIGVISTTSLMHRELTNFIIAREIFPGGHVPSLPLVLQIMNECGLSLLAVESLWPHYQKTLEAWLANFETQWDDIQDLDPAFFNERFRRKWTFYLEGTIENFEYVLDLSHIIFVKGRPSEAYDSSHAPAGPDFSTGPEFVDPLR